jgi:CDP-diacylglycerol--glycerol-3-phosphate 3-phosphatidyltransferase
MLFLQTSALAFWRRISPLLFQYVLNPLGDFVDWAVPQWMHPNVFTVVRALLVIPILLWSDDSSITVPCLLASSACDILDGWLARRRGLVSELGKVLDPYMDKIFILGTLIARWGRVHPAIGVAIFVGELLLVLVRPVQKWLNVDPASSAWGAIKTWSQTIGLGFVLVHIWWLNAASPFVLLFAVFAAYMSFRRHVQRFFVRPATA